MVRLISEFYSDWWNKIVNIYVDEVWTDASS